MKKINRKYFMISLLLLTIPIIIVSNLSVSAGSNDSENISSSNFVQENLESMNKSGWMKKEGKWYYFNDSAVIETGWTKIKNKWYYLNNQGIMQTRWTKVNNKWYYMNDSGGMQTGWIRRGGKWYYLSNSGAMQTGWAKIKNNWYHLDSVGVMQTGWVETNNEWYHLNSSGAMEKNKWIKGKYYLGSNGAMLISSYTPKGYRVDRKGLWVPEAGNYSKINQPNKKQLPSGAVLKEKTNLEHVYTFSKKLPDGGNIKSVRVNAGNKRIYLSGDDRKGDWYSAVYTGAELSVKYYTPMPELSSAAFGLVEDVISDFAVAYSWQDIYKMIEINTFCDGNVYYLGANTNDETLAELLYNSYNRWRMEDSPKIELKKVDNGRIIHSFNGVKNSETHEWQIFSDSCQDGICTKNVDAIKLDKEKSFRIEYNLRE